MRIKTVFLLFLATLSLNAADKFITFAEQDEAVALKGATLSYEATEPKAVQIAAVSLQQDFSRVMGFTPMKAEKATILIGTVGYNKQIDHFRYWGYTAVCNL